MFPPESDWRPPCLSDLPSWRDAKRVAIDVETNDPSIGNDLGPGAMRDGYAVGVSFAIEDGPSYYLPFLHEGGDNLEKKHVVAYLQDQARVFKWDIAGANLPYDINYLANMGVHFRPRFYRDVQVAEPLCDEWQHSYSLDNIAKRHGIPGKDDTLLREAASAWGLHPKAELWRLAARFVGGYAERDVTLPLEILRRQERQIDAEDLWEVYDLESRLLPVLARMHRLGVRISHDRLDMVEAFALAQQHSAVDEINARTGCHLGYDDLNKTEAVAVPLKKLGIKIPKTESGNNSVTKAFLDGLKDPVGQAIVRARKFEKIQGTFVDSIRRYSVGEYLHCTHNQLRRERDDGSTGGGRFGRISASDPNLQQQPSPSKDPKDGPKIGKMWRDIFIPEDGELWVSADYATQEPRLMVHYSEILKYPGATEAAEKLRSDLKMDFHQMMADLTGQERYDAKQIFLGLCYTKGGAALCRDLGLPTKWIVVRNKGQRGSNFRPHDDPEKLWLEVAGEEGQAIMDQFDDAAGFVKKLANRSQRSAIALGFIKTLSGRRCRFPVKEDGTFDWTHLAINRLIQGGAADQTKAAMVAMDDAGIPLRLQVHDEVDFSSSSRVVMLEAKEIMESVYKLRVPSKVDLEVGPSWGSIEKVAA